MNKAHNHEIREFWRAPSRNKQGPFSRFLIKKIKTVVYLQPFFRPATPEFFDGDGNFYPFAHNDCRRVLPVQGTKDAPSMSGFK